MQQISTLLDVQEHKRNEHTHYSIIQAFSWLGKTRENNGIFQSEHPDGGGGDDGGDRRKIRRKGVV